MATAEDRKSRETCTDHKKLSEVILPFVDGPAFVKYGTHPGQDKLTDDCILALQRDAKMLRAIRGVSSNLTMTKAAEWTYDDQQMESWAIEKSSMLRSMAKHLYQPLRNYTAGKTYPKWFAKFVRIAHGAPAASPSPTQSPPFDSSPTTRPSREPEGNAEQLPPTGETSVYHHWGWDSAQGKAWRSKKKTGPYELTDEIFAPEGATDTSTMRARFSDGMVYALPTLTKLAFESIGTEKKTASKQSFVGHKGDERVTVTEKQLRTRNDKTLEIGLVINVDGRQKVQLSYDHCPAEQAREKMHTWAKAYISNTMTIDEIKAARCIPSRKRPAAASATTPAMKRPAAATAI
ncbi:unnamed protein product, partial [Prorocentrum cordatum]